MYFFMSVFPRRTWSCRMTDTKRTRSLAQLYLVLLWVISFPEYPFVVMNWILINSSRSHRYELRVISLPPASDWIQSIQAKAALAMRNLSFAAVTWMLSHVFLEIVLAIVRSWEKYSRPNDCAASTAWRGKNDLEHFVFAGCDVGSGASVLGP